MTIIRLPDDEKGITATFEMFPVINTPKSKDAGRPIFDEIELCRIRIAGNKQSQHCAPAHEVWSYQKQMTEWGTEEKTPITYAMRFNKQYLEFKAGGKQSFSGTLLTELPFLTSAKRLELKALNIHTAEALASLDGQALNMVGPGGRELKNQAMAYIENAQKGATTGQMADELSKRDAVIAELTRRLASITPGAETPDPASEVKPSTVTAFETFEDADLKAWLEDAGVTVDGRWKRNTLIAEAERVLEKQGKKKAA